MRRKAFKAVLRWQSLVLVGAAAFAACLLLPSGTLTGATADDGGPAIVRVEEDWQLVLNEPEVDLDAPQFHTTMSPYGGVDRDYAQVRWNYREQPDFEAGGLQVELWRGADALVRHGVGDQSLSHDAETITWTQRLDAHDGWLRFQVLNGRSVSWGNFGGDGMAVSAPSNVPNLNAYSASASRFNSAITFGANRVNLLRIVEVRRYSAVGLVSTERSPFVVYPLPDAQ